jgi:hypothetical protein
MFVEDLVMIYFSVISWKFSGQTEETTQKSVCTADPEPGFKQDA